MASPPIIDIEALLVPISEDQPSGESLRYEGTYDALQDLMREDDTLEQGEWKRDTKAADWRSVVAAAITALTSKTKDLQIAAWLTRALVKRNGFAGLRDGFQLTRELQERFWDTLYPELDEEDLEFRAGPLDGLNASLPLSIKQVPLTKGSDGSGYALLDWEEARRLDNLARQNAEAYQEAVSEGKITLEELEKAVEATPRMFYEGLLEDIEQAREECEQLDRTGDEKFGRDAPSLVEIKKVIDECHTLIRGIVKRKRQQEGIRDEEGTPESSADQQVDGLDSYAQDSGLAIVPRSGNLPLEPINRADALRRLEAIANFFRRTEPHSPVSYLVQRAARWGTMPLERWLQEVVKSNEVLGHIRETLGLPDEYGGGASSTDESSSESE